MKRLLVLFFLVLALLFGASQILLPALATNYIEDAVKKALRTEAVTTSAGTFPALMMLAGHLDRVDIEAKDAVLGDLTAASLSLHGEGVKLPDDLIAEGHFAIEGADRLELVGVVTEENLARFLKKAVAKAVGELDGDVSVRITPERVSADGKLKVFGIGADVAIEGAFFIHQNEIWFRLRELKVKGLLGRRNIGANITHEIPIYDFSKLNMPVELDDVRLEAGRAVLTASRHPGKSYGDGTPVKKPAEGQK